MYSIASASKATGIPIETLRAWERRYGIQPARDERGRRVYTDDDVARLQRIREAVEAGVPIGRVASLSEDELSALLSRSPQAIYQQRLISAFVRDVIAAAEAYQPQACERALAMATAVLTPTQLVESVLTPSLREVGDRWHRRELCVAQERMVSGAVLRQLHLLLESYSSQLDSAPVVFATLSGERHELGLLMAATVAASRGIRCIYLGADIPADELAWFCRRVDAKAVCCSFILNPEEPVAEELQELRASLPEEIRILVGGAAVIQRSELPLPNNTVITDDLRTFSRELDALREQAA